MGSRLKPPRAGLLLAGVFASAAAAGPVTAGSAAQGKVLYDKQCLVCHDVAPEFHKEGPSLAGVYGRRAGTAPFFGHYKALKGATFTWDSESLDRWLADPRGFVGGRDTGMTLTVADPAQRADLIAYLRSLR